MQNAVKRECLLFVRIVYDVAHQDIPNAEKQFVVTQPNL